MQTQHSCSPFNVHYWCIVTFSISATFIFALLTNGFALLRKTRNRRKGHSNPNWVTLHKIGGGSAIFVQARAIKFT